VLPMQTINPSFDFTTQGNNGQVSQHASKSPHLRLSIPPELKYKYLRNGKANFFHSRVKKLLFQ
jgi:hypothetical protein